MSKKRKRTSKFDCKICGHYCVPSLRFYVEGGKKLLCVTCYNRSGRPPTANPEIYQGNPTMKCKSSGKCKRNPWPKGKSRKRSDAAKKAWRARRRKANKGKKMMRRKK